MIYRAPRENVGVKGARGEPADNNARATMVDALHNESNQVVVRCEYIKRDSIRLAELNEANELGYRQIVGNRIHKVNRMAMISQMRCNVPKAYWGKVVLIVFRPPLLK
jgi:hypothetical protein